MRSINLNSATAAAGALAIVRPAAAAPPRRPEPVAQHRAAETKKPKLRRASFFGPHAPRDKENQPEMPERKHAGAPRCCFGATPLVAKRPRRSALTDEPPPN